ncbi:helix-hairpin-helix domain-containing protein [uncultured Chloroflexus sp.]|uniref:ComEA family DNA-binding protein n=1 Tax=uncultured Chloroflexus sp. TaxID=214040 RepID=UPI0026368C2B|nr:helix-hairpin-helix domain-containing protein [uncultured Chloroflexus sp.]
MWRKLLLVVLLVGIGYLIWRRMQSSSETVITLPLTPPASPPPAPVMPPSAASPAPSAGPRPVATRVHRGAPPKTAPASAPASGDTPSAPRPVATRVHRGAPPERRSPAAVELTATARNGASETVAPQPVEAASSEPVAATDATLAITQDVTTPAVTAPEPAPATPETPVATAPEPSHEEESVAAALATTETTGIEPIDINRADREALIALPGIGSVLADRIIAYREAHGPFKSVDELMAIAGIGERNINTFRKLVYVSHD